MQANDGWNRLPSKSTTHWEIRWKRKLFFVSANTERNCVRSCGWSHRALTTIWLRMINIIAAVISRVLAVERNSEALSSTSTVTVAWWRRQERPLLGDENWTINLNRRLLMCPSLYRFHESWDRREGQTLNVKGEKKWNHLTRLSATWGLFFFYQKEEIRIIFFI